MDTKYTCWFPASKLPVRVGVYERDYHGHLEYSYWGGAEWCFSSKTIGGAFLSKVSSRFQDLPWRGLLKEDV